MINIAAALLFFRRQPKVFGVQIVGKEVEVCSITSSNHTARGYEQLLAVLLLNDRVAASGHYKSHLPREAEGRLSVYSRNYEQRDAFRC